MINTNEEQALAPEVHAEPVDMSVAHTDEKVSD